ncbi:hypothetical protein ANN_09076 [Periplaneta americana]|uniref:Transient receptor potential cation channel subfamily A member 1 n=1 Tax=Periplaneta americana TaxID=6978 RepID=A0ABQ8TKS3_PERAM|nr:hypothetical protein ANN_09076 [Periplaneta americana]
MRRSISVIRRASNGEQHALHWKVVITERNRESENERTCSRKSKSGRSHTCKKGDALAFESRLLHFHGDINLTAGDSYGNTLLHLAVKSSSSECVSLLLKRNANPDVKNVDMDTPLHLAAQLESSECVRLLLDAGARACECNSTGNTPLHYAAEECSTDTLQILIDYIRDNPFYNLEFEINALNDNKRSPLHLAAQSGSLKCVKLLFENKSNLTSVDEVDNTALHYAAMSGSADCVKFLIDNGADLLAVNNAKYTALSYIVDSMPNGEDLLINILNEGICLSKLDNEKEKLKINLSVLCPESRNRIAVANRLYSSHRFRFGRFPNFWRNSTTNSTDDGYLTYVTEALSSMRFASIVASVLFVMVVIIALLNMLVALAVRGGDELLDYGKVYHLWSQAQLLYEWNEVKRFLRMKSRSIETYFYLDRNGYITIGDKDVPTTLRHELSVVAKYKDQKRKNKLNISAIETLIEDKLSSFLYEIKDLKDNLMTALRNDTRQEI